MRTARPRTGLAILFTAWMALGAPVPACAQGAERGQNSPAATAPASDPARAVNAARIRVAEGKLDSAIDELARYVAAYPAELEPARYLGDLYYRAGDLTLAERTYVLLLRHSPNDRETHDRLGGIYAAQDRVREAIEQFQKSLPGGDAYGHLVDLHRRLGDLDRFEALFRRDADAAPGDPGAQYALGAILRAERRPSEAVTYLERSLTLAPRACSTLSELGSAYLDMDRLRPAVEVLQRCLRERPDDYAALVNLGDAFIQDRQYERARPILEHANRVRPDGPEALVDIGYLEDAGSHWDRAVSYYLKAIGVDPLVRDAYVDLGYDYDEHHLFALAEAAFLKGLSISPDDGRLHYLLGVTYAEQGKRELARAEYRRATASDEPEVARAASRDLSSLQ